MANIEASVMTGSESTGTYHDLWRVEQSFRMSKTDVRARPIFKDTIERQVGARPAV